MPQMPKIYEDTPGSRGRVFRDQLLWDPMVPDERSRFVVGDPSGVGSYNARFLGPGDTTYATSHGDRIGTLYGDKRNAVYVDAPLEVARDQFERVTTHPRNQPREVDDGVLAILQRLLRGR